MAMMLPLARSSTAGFRRLPSRPLACAAAAKRHNSTVGVCKFGGTSMATKDSVDRVKTLMHAEKGSDRVSPQRDFIVVSAPGKRFKGDVKTTDLLIELGKKINKTSTGSDGPAAMSAGQLLEEICGRYTAIISAFGVASGGFEQKFKPLQEELLAGVEGTKPIGHDFLVSRGEYLSALMVSEIFKCAFIDAQSCIFMRSGKIDYEKTNASLKQEIAKIGGGKKIVVPGFYGWDLDLNAVAVLPRGGSDITGALVAHSAASGSGAVVYENWTDVPGVFTADPNQVTNAKKIPELSYTELRVLGRNGAQVLQPDTLAIPGFTCPVHLRNTFGEGAPPEGTWINPDAGKQGKAKLLGLVIGSADDGSKKLAVVGPNPPGSFPYEKERAHVAEALGKVVSASTVAKPAIEGDSSPWLVAQNIEATKIGEVGTAVHKKFDELGMFEGL